MSEQQYKRLLTALDKMSFMLAGLQGYIAGVTMELQETVGKEAGKQAYEDLKELTGGNAQ